MNARRLGFLVLCGVFFLPVGVSRGETLRLNPKAPEVGQPFKVILLDAFVEDGLGNLPADAKFSWSVSAKVGETPVEPAAIADGLVDGKLETMKPLLPLKKAVANATYRIEGLRVTEPAGEAVVMTVVFDEEFGQLSTGEPMNGQPPAATPPSPMPPVVSATPMPMGESAPAPMVSTTTVNWPNPPVLTPGQSIQANNNRIKEARQWLNANVIKDLKPQVMGEDFEAFIVKKLTESRDRKFSLKEELDSQVIAAARFYRAAYETHQAGGDSAKILANWKIQREQMLTQIENDDQETVRSIRLAREFLEDLESEIKDKAKEKIDVALLEAAMITGKLLLKHEEESRESVGSGDDFSPTNGSGSPTYSGSSYGPSHAAVHHARVMSRIRMRNERQMARIRGYQ